MLNFFLNNRFSHIEAGAEGQRTSHGVLATVMSVVLLITASAVGMLLSVVVLYLLNPDAVAALEARDMGALSVGELGLFLFFGHVFAFATFWLWLKFREKRAFSSIGFRGGRGLFKFARGAAGGVAAMTAIAGILWVSGNMELAEQTPLAASWLAGPAALLLLAGWLVQGTAEEVMARGYLLQAVGARHGVVAGVIISSLVFTGIHGANSNPTVLFFVNLVLYSLFTAIYVLREGGLWGAAGFHGAWNLVQGNIFGFSVSGEFAGTPTIFLFDMTGPDIITGGATGAEGSLVAAVVLLLCIAAVWRISGGFSAKSEEGAEAEMPTPDEQSPD